jgi:hypothetical protein
VVRVDIISTILRIVHSSSFDRSKNRRGIWPTINAILTKPNLSFGVFRFQALIWLIGSVNKYQQRRRTYVCPIQLMNFMSIERITIAIFADGSVGRYLSTEDNSQF